MKRIALCIFGAVMFMVALWGGSYAMHLIGTQSWCSFPMFMTSILSGVGGVTLFVGNVLD